MFVQSTCDLDTLVRVQTPSSAQLMQKMRLRSGSIAPGRVQTSSSQPLIQQSSALCIDDLYRDRKPPLPMHRAPHYAGLHDPVHRHGTQALEMRALEKKGMDDCSQTYSLSVLSSFHLSFLYSCSALTLLVESQEGHRACKNLTPDPKCSYLGVFRRPSLTWSDLW